MAATRHRAGSPAPLLVIALALGLLQAGCPPRGPVQTPPPVISDTSLGPGDVIIVDVFNEETLENKSFQVASDGSIDYPLIDRITVAGLKPEEVADLITLKLIDGGFLKNPQVSVLVKEYKSKRIHVLGEVKKPGTFPYQEDMNVVQAISMAGGFTALAKDTKVSVTRKIEGKEVVFVVDVKSIIQNKAPNVPLQSSDIVYVPERVF